MREEGIVQRLIAALFQRRYGNQTWDGVVRLSGALALLAIPLMQLVPTSGGLVGFALVTIWVNGPISPVLPATYEPILMVFGRAYSPLLVAGVGTAGTLYVEYLNYHLYRRVLRAASLRGFRERRVTRRLVDWFSRVPFFTIWLCSWSVFPYWPVRFMSPLAEYDVRRHLLATSLGRFPRLWFFAALGVWWKVPVSVLAAIATGATAIALVAWWVRTRRARPTRSVALATVEVGDG